MANKTRTFNWKSLVEKADPKPAKEPIVYDFGPNEENKKRDSGPSGGVYGS